MDVSTLRFSRTHEWASVQEGVATIGISQFAVKLLTDLVYIDLPGVGKQVVAGQRFGEVESVKAVSDLYSPVSGEIVAINDKLANDLGLLSDDPYGKGWILRVKMSDASELSKLLDAAAYDQHCQSADH